MTFEITMSDADYVASRSADAAAILSAMQWTTGNVSGTLQCKLYGHSILWDIKRTALHAGDWCAYEVLPAGADDVECFETLEGLLAWILRRNW